MIISTAILALSFVGPASATSWSVDGSGGADFIRIQEAINNASAGDTILVHSGVYYEKVVVNKLVTLKGVGYPIVDARGEGSAITLIAGGITLEGFNATNAGSSLRDAGIVVTSNDNIIAGNIANNNSFGIYLGSYRNNIITGNNANNNYCGIRLYSSSNNNTITGNNASNNSYGIELYFSSNNTITGNTFVNDGLTVSGSYQNTVEDNMVNGKPLVYLKDVSNYKVEDAGQVILVNCTNITVENLDLSNTGVGVALLKTEDSKVFNNTASSNNRYGIILSGSNNNTITGNNASNNSAGIILYDSSNNDITGNNASNNREGIYLWLSNNNTITGNSACSNRYGIRLRDSSNNNTIRSNKVCNNGEGIYLWLSSNNTITGNDVRRNKWYGIDFSSSSNNTIKGNTFVNDGLSGSGFCQNTVEDNTVNGKPLVYLEDVSNYKVEDAGQVILVKCNNITVENLDLSNTSVGVALWNTEDSKIFNNTASNNKNGISIDYSSNNTITGNNAHNNFYGISLYSSSNNIITGNNASVRLYRSCNNTISGNNVNNHRVGIYLRDSRNNTITGNNVSDNEKGIYPCDSRNNIITGNTFVNDGLFVEESYQNTVEENKVNGKPLVYLEDVSDYKVTDAGQVILVNCNNITVENQDLSNTSVGIVLWETEDSKVLNNTVNNNDDGIMLYSSSNNIHLNNFIGNLRYVRSYASTNIWNSPLEITYTYGGTTYTNYLGNYWDDYEGTDAEGDGIGNTPYSIESEEDESDDYPLMQPFENYLT